MAANSNLVFKKIEREEGDNSKAIYSIEHGGNKWILKLMIRSDDNIIEVSNFIHKNHPELESSLILPTIYGEFDGIKYQVMKAAEGNSIYSSLELYINKRIPSTYLKSCYEDLGYKLANIHSKGGINNKSVTKLFDLLTSYVHSDAHHNNLFCDKDGKVVIIDADFMIYSINSPMNVLPDLEKILWETVSMALQIKNDVQSFNKAQRTEYSEAILSMGASFVKGYTSNLKNLNKDINSKELKQDISHFYKNVFSDTYLDAYDTHNRVEENNMISKVLGEAFEDYEMS